MKKLLTLAMAFVLIFALAACGEKKAEEEKSSNEEKKTEEGSEKKDEAGKTDEAEKKDEAGKTEEKKMDKIVVSEFRGTKYAAIHLAYAFGYFKDEGLDVEFAVYGDGPVAFQGMHAGDSQFCLLSIDPVFRAFDEGLESKVIGAVDTTRLYSFVGAKDITEIAQLKGKTIFAGAPGSAPYSFIWSVLEGAGLKPAEDISFAQMQYGASLSALEQGTIAASYIDYANINKAKEIGATILIDGADPETKKAVFGSDKFEGSIITCTKKYVEENPEVVQRFMNAVVKASKWIKEHSLEELVDAVLPYHEGSTKEELMERIGLELFAYTEDCRISTEGYEAMENFAIKTGLIKEKIGFENIIDMSFVENANK